MKSKSDALRYPAFPQTNALTKAVDEAQKQAFLVRLTNKKFLDQQLSKCKTVDEILKLSDLAELAKKRHEHGLKLLESKKVSNLTFYSDVDEFQGIPITVSLDLKVASKLIEKQAKYDYFTKSVVEVPLHEVIEDFQDVLTETSGIYHEISKPLKSCVSDHTKNDLDKIDLSNTDYLYELASKSEWKLMMDHNGFVLPGAADPYRTCGKFRFSVCREHSYGKRILQNCNRLSCPTCVKRAGSRIAKKIERRIWLYHLMVQKTTNQKRNDMPSHVIESIPPDDIFWKWSQSKKQRTLQKMRQIAGIKGGVSISHLWRFEDNKINPYLSIHNHLICFGWIRNGADIKQEIFQKFGVNVVYHKVQPNGTLLKRNNVFSLGYYLLSHVSVKNHKHSVHWFGELSYRKIKNSYLKQFRDDLYLEIDLDIEKSKSCKMCGEFLVPAKIDKDFKNWQGFLPDQEDMDEGCMFPEGLLLELNFFKEKMHYYDLDYFTILHQTHRELEEIKIKTHKKLYVRSTNNSKLKNWMN